MRYNLLTIILTVGLCSGINGYAQDYTSTPVSISSEKVKMDGILYYSHIVLEKQTLYSISKAYQVAIQDILDANKAINLQEEGIKVGQVILIPIVEKQTAPTESPKDVEYISYTVKWYDTLDGIADKYGISKESLIAFNNLSSEKLSKRQVLKIPVHDSENDNDAYAISTSNNDINESSNNIEDLTIESQNSVNLSLILPLNAGQSINDSYYDFYSGVLIALKDLKDSGIDTNLKVIDISKREFQESDIAQSDLIIGPVSSADIRAVSEVCPENAYIISPLDQKAGELAASNRKIIQAPSGNNAQLEDMVNWIVEDLKAEDKVILVSEKGSAPSSLKAILDSSKVSYESVSYGILEGRNVSAALERIMTSEGTNRFLIDSEKEAFVNDVVRNINLMIFAKYNSVLYAPSKFRNFETIEVENFHKASMHVSNAYYVDYDNPKVKNFLFAYRALCQAEPTPFAYQGYDTTFYFISQLAKYGHSWPHFATFERELQSNYNIEMVDNGGAYNKAIRRVVYGEDYSINLIN